ncbi:hypothetical protein OPV22_021661 [Ensete ventricosum]|uniref:Uncharacterized protein n=1 Tax=Ensete ventricosum TaxID=4639 RepID=A0AAV8QDP0_ENSVE|nr:hypothetical protein OPV22_021661 [Ensete ventricosum]
MVTTGWEMLPGGTFEDGRDAAAVENLVELLLSLRLSLSALTFPSSAARCPTDSTCTGNTQVHKNPGDHRNPLRKPNLWQEKTELVDRAREGGSSTDPGEAVDPSWDGLQK